MEDFFDEQWLSTSFLVSEGSVAGWEHQYKDWSTADDSLYSARLGGNLVINPRPQYTRYADIRSKGANSASRAVEIHNMGGMHGMGRFYSAQQNDTMDVLTIRVGVVQYSSIANFARKMFDSDFAYFANTGKARTKTLTILGKVIGVCVGVYLFGVVGLMLIGIRETASFFGAKTSRFSAFKPEPQMYWSACNNILNNILVNEGFIRSEERADPDSRVVPTTGGDRAEETYLQKVHELLPDVYIDKYGVDLFAIATKAQRLSDQRFRERLAREDSTSFEAFIGGEFGSVETPTTDPSAWSLADFVRKFTTFSYFTEDGSGGHESHMTLNPKENALGQNTGKDGVTLGPTPGSETDDAEVAVPADADKYFDYFGALRQQAADFVSFRVNHVASVSESFSTTVGESEISLKVNSASSTAREARFALAGGNLGDSAFTNMIESAGRAVGEIATHAADTMSLGLSNALQGVFGAAYIDFTKVFKNSTVSLPTHTFTVDLNTPYNNSVSRMINMHVPLSCLLPLIMPLSTGRQSYTSPFALQMFLRGKLQSRYCMMKSMQVERGITNTPFDTDGHCMGFRVTFSFVDMASIVHMPISTGPMFGGNRATDSDSVLYDYLAVLGGLDIKSQLYRGSSARLGWAKTKTGFQLATSSAAWAMYSESIVRSKYVSFLTLTGSNLLGSITPAAAITKSH